MNDNRILTSSWIENFILRDESKNNFSFITKVFTVVCCSLILVLSAKIKVDLYPVPMTLQPLAILMIAMLCGRNIAVASVSFYLFQGMVGLPVFAYGGGLLYLIGPTGGFLFGFDAGIISGVMSFAGPEFNLTEIQSGWVVSSPSFAAMFAMLFSGRFSDLIGRKKC